MPVPIEALMPCEKCGAAMGWSRWPDMDTPLGGGMRIEAWRMLCQTCGPKASEEVVRVQAFHAEPKTDLDTTGMINPLAPWTHPWGT